MEIKRTEETNLVTVLQDAQKALPWSRGPRVLFDGNMEIKEEEEKGGDATSEKADIGVADRRKECGKYQDLDIISELAAGIVFGDDSQALEDQSVGATQ
ncbi:uncharacterized protein TrAtP1_010373 [Trichoderma atroviride]|uniref:uncharacterized protein n=1 Tax=Hypocrea atroviridis TaxID=63577 RepID=UPI0033314EB1|nr:hypothetical protein TrAtP1_010373 [Trichoderma atroviride]